MPWSRGKTVKTSHKRSQRKKKEIFSGVFLRKDAKNGKTRRVPTGMWTGTWRPAIPGLLCAFARSRKPPNGGALIFPLGSPTEGRHKNSGNVYQEGFAGILHAKRHLRCLRSGAEVAEEEERDIFRSFFTQRREELIRTLWLCGASKMRLRLRAEKGRKYEIILFFRQSQFRWISSLKGWMELWHWNNTKSITFEKVWV